MLQLQLQLQGCLLELLFTLYMWVYILVLMLMRRLMYVYGFVCYTMRVCWMNVRCFFQKVLVLVYVWWSDVTIHLSRQDFIPSLDLPSTFSLPFLLHRSQATFSSAQSTTAADKDSWLASRRTSLRNSSAYCELPSTDCAVWTPTQFGILHGQPDSSWELLQTER